MPSPDDNRLVFEFNGKLYPDFIRRGNACKFIAPFAQEFCTGKGFDVGGVGKWVFPGAHPINVTNNDGYDANHLPDERVNYIFSSHTLEHVPDYVGALLHWKSRLLPGGVLFLYLPHPNMEYWRPEDNRKHYHMFYPKDIKRCLERLGFRDVLTSNRDLYWSFAAVAFV